MIDDSDVHNNAFVTHPSPSSIVSTSATTSRLVSSPALGPSTKAIASLCTTTSAPPLLWPPPRLLFSRSAVNIPQTEPILSTRPLSVVIECSDNTTHGTLKEGEGGGVLWGARRFWCRLSQARACHEHEDMKQQSTGTRSEMIWWMWMGGCNNYYLSQH